MIAYIVAIFLMVIPFSIVGFWTKRPIISLCVASFFVFLIGAMPGIINTFQAMMIYGSGDPQLMAGGISEAIVSSILSLIFILPFLILFQWVVRRRQKSKEKRAVLSELD